MATSYPHIRRDNDIAITINGIPFTIKRGDARYDKVVSLLSGTANNDAAIRDVIDGNALAAERFSAKSDVFTFEGNNVLYRGEAVHGKLASRILRMEREGAPSAALAAFLDKLAQNPSKRVVDNAYDFIEFGLMAIDLDGDFYAYKRVNRAEPTQRMPLDPAMKERGYNFNLVDVHSGKFSNAVGTVVSMPRNKVNDDPDVTCSYGLHVCSHDYLKSFSGSHVVTCKINPADIVAIPRDYNQTKMRVCRYEVVNILDEERVKAKVLSSKSVLQIPTEAPLSTVNKGSVSTGERYSVTWFDKSGRPLIEWFNVRQAARDKHRANKLAGLDSKLEDHF